MQLSDMELAQHAQNPDLIPALHKAGTVIQTCNSSTRKMEGSRRVSEIQDHIWLKGSLRPVLDTRGLASKKRSIHI